MALDGLGSAYIRSTLHAVQSSNPKRMTSISAGPPDLSQILGPLVVGDLILFTLFGVLTVQAFLYYLAFPRDKPITKVLVYGIYALLLVQFVMVGREAFQRYTSPGAASRVGLGWFYVPVTCGFTSLVVQCFYAWRILVLSGKRAGSIAISMIAFLSSTAAWTAAAFGSQAGPDVISLNSPNENARKMRIFDGIAFISSAVCDVIIAMSMIYLLTRNGRIMHRRTRSVVGRLLRLTIETNTITSLVAITSVATLYAFPDTTFFATSAMLLPEVYANTFFLMLNSRMNLIHGQDSAEAQGDPSMADLSLPPIENLSPSEPNINVRGSAIVIDFPDESKSDDDASSKGH
ncbi:hypothetical protein Moror_10643 [Moniliophthora roreri MCA 2997]|uniref:DUF6534 domain-containing protein n=1 Tax=Moniliophthora roreri (strain MCA 2997) TaxID=1381753 RepID=V2WY02_MONRO|nr:hypothetical protein Moror_10643 [Moniliophthora roreri MCA 2997]